jgi:hypothetical protein
MQCDNIRSFGIGLALNQQLIRSLNYSESVGKLTTT